MRIKNLTFILRLCYKCSMSTRKKGRPSVDPASKRQRINLTLSPAIILQAEEYRLKRGIGSLSELIEMALKATLRESETVASAPSTAENILAFPEIPLLHAAAGSPAPSDTETFAPIRSYGAGRFACQLHGDSMAPKYPDGSTVILRDRASLKRPVLKNGEIFLFTVRGEKTLKIYGSRKATKEEIDAGISYQSTKDGKPKVRILRSINPAFPEIVIDGDSDWIGWLDEKDNATAST
jgi:hypothetical protein